jgi:hypothetical protein
MIDPIESDVGRKVVYRDRSGHVVEEGVITSFNHACVFVRYGAGQISKGTRREDLEWRRRDEDTRPSRARPSRCRRARLARHSPQVPHSRHPRRDRCRLAAAAGRWLAPLAEHGAHGAACLSNLGFSEI